MPDNTRTVNLSRRERQIMDIAYQHGRVTVAEVLKELPDPPSYSAVRAMMSVLEKKGHVKHHQDGPRYVYVPTVSRNKARQSALRQLLQTFFDNSTENAVAALLDMEAARLSGDELERLERMIQLARQEGR